MSPKHMFESQPPKLVILKHHQPARNEAYGFQVNRTNGDGGAFRGRLLWRKNCWELPVR
jgi:hypothetical protein